jgi:hypothetical protein
MQQSSHIRFAGAPQIRRRAPINLGYDPSRNVEDA